MALKPSSRRNATALQPILQRRASVVDVNDSRYDLIKRYLVNRKHQSPTRHASIKYVALASRRMSWGFLYCSMTQRN